jgi:predicted dehydrogenase
LPDARVFTDTAEMLRTLRPDALHICTPLPSHVALVSQAVAAGIPALVEKPLTASAAETKLILEAAERSKVLVCPVHQYAFQDGFLSTRSRLEHMGGVLHGRFTICSAGGAGLDGPALDRIVADILPHPFSVIRALWPDTELPAAGWTTHRPRPGELRVSGALGMTTFELCISMQARPTRSELEILCRDGHIHVDFFHGYAIAEQSKVSRYQKIIRPLTYAVRSLLVAGVNLARRGLRSEPAYPGLRRLIDGFYSAVAGTAPPPIPPRDIIFVAAVRDLIIGATQAQIATTGADGE